MASGSVAAKASGPASETSSKSRIRTSQYDSTSQQGGEIPSGVGAGCAGHGFRGSGHHHFAAACAALRAEVDDPIGGADDVEVVFDHDQAAAVSISRPKAASSLAISSKCRPVVGSSKMNRVPRQLAAAR